jgi:hypothetical protein
MTELDSQMERFRLGILEVQATIRDRFTPAIQHAADAMHLFWYELLPWYGRWWHLVTGHRSGGCLTHPWPHPDEE